MLTATAEDLIIDSPTGVDVALPLAGPGARAFAFVLDWHIRAVLALAWYVVAAVIYHGELLLVPPLDPTGSWFAAAVVPPAAIFFLYHFVLEIAMRGRTPGKRMVGVRIVTRAGQPPSMGALLLRNVFRMVDSFPLVYSVGLISTMVTRDHVRIGDLAAGTVLVYDNLKRFEGKAERSHEHTGAVERIQQLWRHKARNVEEAERAVEDYRLLARELASARRGKHESPTREYLEAAYARSHALLYKPGAHPLYAALTLFRDQIPAAISQLRPHIMWVTLLFVTSILAGHWMVRTYPDLIGLFASPGLIATVERGELWTEGLLNIMPSSVLSVKILTNNIIVSLFAFCAGFLFGLGTFYIVALNGLMLGAVFAFTGIHGLDDNLFSFIVAHGCVELSCMCLSGAAGASIGEALIRPGTATRTQAFQQAAAPAGRVLFVCVLLLIGAGFIEGYISPAPEVPLWTRVAVGVGYWVFMVAVLRGWLFRRKGHP